MANYYTIENRLEEIAKTGNCKGDILLYRSQVKTLKKENIVFRNPKRSNQEGLYLYEVDFSHPLVGTDSAKYYKLALKAQLEKFAKQGKFEGSIRLFNAQAKFARGEGISLKRRTATDKKGLYEYKFSYEHPTPYALSEELNKMAKQHCITKD